MAPEDFHPEEQSDRQSDIWAVGVILYEMLAGRRPFQVAKSKDPFAWKIAVESAPIPPVTDLRPDTPPELQAIVSRALARDKTARYHDAGSMAADLRELSPPPQFWGAGLGRTIPSSPAPTLTPQDWGGGPSPSLPGFPPDLANIDGFLAAAPDRWDAARDTLSGGGLARWLRAVGEEPLAQVADEVSAGPDRDDDDKLRDFLYRAGLDTADVARRAYTDGQKLEKNGRYSEAVSALHRAVHLDPSRPEYAQELASALRASGNFSGAALVLEQALLSHPAQRKLVRDHAEIAGAAAVLSESQVDFGVLRRGQNRSCKLTLSSEGGGLLECRVAAAPGWVRVEPPTFSTRKRQALTLTAQTENVWTAPAAYSETVVLETSGGRQEIAVSVSILPARLAWSSVVLWYLPLLLAALLPAVTGYASNNLLAGLVAGGLLSLSVFVLTLAADIAWVPRLLPLALGGCAAALTVRALPHFANRSSAAHLVLLQTLAPVLVLLILQTCAFAFDSRGWGRWQLWRWIIGATGLLVGYSLLHLG